MTHPLKSSIALFCEGIWVYYGFVLMIKLQWQIVTPQQPWVWFLAGIVGLGLSYLFQFVRKNISFQYTLYILGAGVVLYFWNANESVTHWLYRIAGSGVLLFIYFRSVYFALKEPQRQNMLLRLEGNMLCYFLFVLVQIKNPFTTNSLYAVFIIACILSLIGMVLTLGEKTENDSILTRSVGSSSWVVVPSLGLVALVLLIGSLLLSTNVRLALSQGVSGITAALFSIGHDLLAAFKWLIQLLPGIKEEKPLTLHPAPSPGSMQGENPAQTGGIAGPFLLGVVVIVSLGLLFYLAKFLRQHHKNKSPIRKEVRTMNISWGVALKEWLHQLWIRLLARFQQFRPVSYSEPIYRYYARFLRWGERQGIPRHRNETPEEYAGRLCNQIQAGNEIKLAIQKLSEAFAATYYSEKKDTVQANWDALIMELETIKKFEEN